MADSNDDLNIDELYAFAIDLSKRAGQLLVAATEQRRAAQNNNHVISSTQKLNSVDLVTETDERSLPIITFINSHPALAC